MPACAQPELAATLVDSHFMERGRAGRLLALLASPGFELLRATRRHTAVLEQTVNELPEIRGNQMHDLHTAVLMRKHGVSRICTRDTGFHRFPFPTVVDPLRRRVNLRKPRHGFGGE